MTTDMQKLAADLCGMSDKNQAVPVPAKELEQLRLDAARYRYARTMTVVILALGYALPEEVDAAIDAHLPPKWEPFAPDPDPDYRK